MANTNNTKVNAVTVKEVKSVARGIMLPEVDRWVKVLRDDTGNILNSIGQSKLLIPSGAQTLSGDTDKVSLEKEYDRIFEIYVQKMNELDSVVKGETTFKQEVYNFERLNVSFNPLHDYTSTGYAYGYVYNQRIIKQLIAQTLNVPALSHGKFTEILGVLRFRIEGVTRQEINALYLAYPDLIVGIEFNEKKEGTRSGSNNTVNPRSAKIVTKRQSVIVRPSITDDSPKKANKEQLEILARAKKEHVENGLTALDTDI